MSTQVQLYTTPLSLLSIPKEHYTYFCHGITKLVLKTWKQELRLQSFAQLRGSGPDSQRSSRSEDNSIADSGGGGGSSEPSIEERLDSLDEFINVSLTPVECSVICPTELVNLLFGEQLKMFGDRSEASVGDAGVVPQVLHDQYLAIQVDSEGGETGSRVLELTEPLSEAKIPIFFIPTYFSDYVLVPCHERDRVSKALESLGFVFSDMANSYISVVSPGVTPPGTARSTSFSDASTKSPLSSSQGIVNDFSFMTLSSNPNDSSGSVDTFDNVLKAAQNSQENATFDLFAIHDVMPEVDRFAKLLLTGARAYAHTGHSNRDKSRASDSIFLEIIRILTAPPKYFSLTVALGTEVSFLVDEETAQNFPDDSLLGSPTDFVVPISFDFRNLPEDSTGIIAGIASRLIGPQKHLARSPITMSYLSTAKSGIVIVSEEDIESAIDALDDGQETAEK